MRVRVAVVPVPKTAGSLPVAIHAMVALESNAHSASDVRCTGHLQRVGARASEEGGDEQRQEDVVAIDHLGKLRPNNKSVSNL